MFSWLKKHLMYYTTTSKDISHYRTLVSWAYLHYYNYQKLRKKKRKHIYNAMIKASCLTNKQFIYTLYGLFPKLEQMYLEPKFTKQYERIMEECIQRVSR